MRKAHWLLLLLGVDHFCGFDKVMVLASEVSDIV